jgi:hypothetical protein
MGSRIDIDDNLVIERYNELKNLKKVAKKYNLSFVENKIVYTFTTKL